MKSLGNWLRAARETKGVSHKEVEEVIRIRARYLQALETGDYAALSGGRSQIRGFLRSYASYLGLSADEAVNRYDQESNLEREPGPLGVEQHLTPPPNSSATTSPPAVAQPKLRTVAIVGGIILIVLVLIAGGWWLATRSGLFGDADPTPSVTDVLSPMPLPLTASAASATPDPVEITPTFAPAAGGGLTLRLEPLEHVWVRVMVDDSTVFEGMMAPGDDQGWTVDETVIVETGNGAAVIAIVNGQSQGPIGDRNQLSARGWGVTGEIQVPPPAVVTVVP